MSPKTVHHQTLPVAELGDAQVDQMFQLMESHYDYVNRAQFEADLAWKDTAILLLDEEGAIHGFSTIALNPKGTEGANYDILFSGDTIIDRQYWGTQELVRGFSLAAGERKQPGRRLLWMLLSKGHRTYAYLPLFAHRYFPAVDPERQAEELAPVLAICADQLFGAAWKPEQGIVRFEERVGQLKPELADGTLTRPKNKNVQFFLERNPGYAEGDELVCMTELEPDNLRRTVRQAFLEAWEARGEAVRS